MEMGRLTRDGTAEPVSRDQILRHARGQGNIIFPVQLTTSRIGNLTRLIHTLLYVMTIHTYIHICYRELTKYLTISASAIMNHKRWAAVAIPYENTFQSSLVKVDAHCLQSYIFFLH